MGSTLLRYYNWRGRKGSTVNQSLQTCALVFFGFVSEPASSELSIEFGPALGVIQSQGGTP